MSIPIKCQQMTVHYTMVFAILLLTGWPSLADQVADLRRLTRSRDDVEACRAMVRLARVYQEQGDPRKALRETQQYGGLTENNLQWPRCLVFVEHARLCMASGQDADALSRLDYALRRSAGLSRVLALEAFGDCMARTGRPTQAGDYYEQAMKLGAETFPSLEQSAEKHIDARRDEWHAAHARMTAARQRLQRLLMIEELGLDYVLYKEAREHQAAGRQAAAWDTFSELYSMAAGTMYGEAAAFYRGLCISGDRASLRTRRYFQAFIKEQPMGLYRGEAAYILAEMELRETWQASRAAEAFTEVIKWCERARAAERSIKLAEMPEKSRVAVAPPPDNQQTLDWGMIETVDIPPDKLVNRRTARWYLDDLEKRACLSAAFCRMVNGQWQEAQEVLDRIPNLDEHIRRAQEAHRPNTYWRMKRACELRKFAADPLELERVPEKVRFLIAYGDFLYLTRDWTGAENTYQAALAEAAAARNRPAAAVALVSLAEMMWNLGRPAEARQAFRQVIERYPGTPSAAHASFCLGNIGEDPEISWEDRLEEDLALYDQAQKWGKGTFYEQNALGFSVSLLLSLKRVDEARLRARRLLQNYPGKGWERFVNEIFAEAGEKFP